MQVDTIRTEYAAMSPIWRRARDFNAGQDVIKAAGTAYLPMLGDTQTPAEYAAFKLRADFYNATGRTIEGLSGLLFRKPAVIEPGRIDEIAQNIALADVGVDVFAQHAATEILTVGRGGGLVDFPRSEEPLSMADAQANGVVPMWAWYDTENIINWRYDTGTAKPKLILLVLREQETEPTQEDPFVTNYRSSYRVLRIDENGQYSQQRFVEVYADQRPETNLASQVTPVGAGISAMRAGQSAIVPIDEEPYYPLQDGEPMREIPFVWFAPKNRGAEIQKPPLIDLINCNWKHYTVSADQAHGLHFAALPTPVVTGVAKEDVPTEIGPLRTWVLEPTEAKAFMLEAELPGMEQITKKLTSLEWQMATLGARMLAPDTVNDETATAAVIRSSSDTSSLANMADSISTSMTLMMQITDRWLGGGTEEVFYELPKDFLATPMGAQELLAYVQAWQEGGISKQTLFENLQRGEVARENKTFEEEENEIETGAPTVGEQ